MTENESRLNTLKANLRGELIQASDESYDAARKVYNSMIDKHPAAIARCADVAEHTSALVLVDPALGGWTWSEDFSRSMDELAIWMIPGKL